MMATPCHVYLLAHEEGGVLVAPVKVGVTVSLNNRIATLRTGNPRPIGLVFSFIMPSSELARLAESRFHEAGSGGRLQGEWFDIKPSIALIMLTWDIFAPSVEDGLPVPGFEDAIIRALSDCLQ